MKRSELERLTEQTLTKSFTQFVQTFAGNKTRLETDDLLVFLYVTAVQTSVAATLDILEQTGYLDVED